MSREIGNEFRKVVRLHALKAILAGDAVTLDPVAMDDRRLGMRDRPADGTSGANRLAHDARLPYGYRWKD